MKFYFVRHGRTHMNELNKGQGWLDSDLTKRGKRELHDLYSKVELPSFDSAYSSDLGRTVKTLRILKEYITLNNPDNVFRLEDLRERFLGSFEGDYLNEIQLYIAQEKGYDTYIDYQKENTFADYIDDNRKLDPNGHAENYEMFEKRVVRAFQQIESDAISNDWESVLIVAHQNTIGLIQYLLSETSKGFERIRLANGEAMIFLYENGKWEQIAEE